MREYDGFLRLSRAYFHHFFWEEPRPFSRAEAWLDLIQQAAYAPRTCLVKGRPVVLQRGSLLGAVRWLAGRWQWSNTKVCQFLEVLRGEGMITLDKQHRTTVVTLTNYEAFNPSAAVRRAEKARSRPAAPDSSDPEPALLPTPGRAQSREEVVAYATSLALPESDGAYLWETWEASGWLRAGHPIEDWQAAVRAWKEGGFLPSQKQIRSAPRSVSRAGGTHDPEGKAAAQYGA